METYITPDGRTKYRMTQSEFDRYNPKPEATPSPSVAPETPALPKPPVTGLGEAFWGGLVGDATKDYQGAASYAAGAGNLTRSIGVVGGTGLAAGAASFNPIIGIGAGVAADRTATKALNLYHEGADMTSLDTAGQLARATGEGVVIGGDGAFRLVRAARPVRARR